MHCQPCTVGNASFTKKTAYKAQSAQMKEHQDKLAYDSVQASSPNLVNQVMSFEIRKTSNELRNLQPSQYLTFKSLSYFSWLV
jgi:hypothetical protein